MDGKEWHKKRRLEENCRGIQGDEIDKAID